MKPGGPQLVSTVQQIGASVGLTIPGEPIEVRSGVNAWWTAGGLTVRASNRRGVSRIGIKRVVEGKGYEVGVAAELRAVRLSKLHTFSVAEVPEATISVGVHATYYTRAERGTGLLGELFDELRLSRTVRVSGGRRQGWNETICCRSRAVDRVVLQPRTVVLRDAVFKDGYLCTGLVGESLAPLRFGPLIALRLPGLGRIREKLGSLPDLLAEAAELRFILPPVARWNLKDIVAGSNLCCGLLLLGGAGIFQVAFSLINRYGSPDESRTQGTFSGA